MFPSLNSISIRRKRLDMSQSAFAKSVGISQSMLTKIERGLAHPSYVNAIKIFDKLDELEHKGEKTAAQVMHSPVILLEITDTVAKAAKLAKEHSISQFPVMRDGKMVGSIRTTDLIDLPEDAKIGWKIDPPFSTVDESTPISSLVALIKSGQVIIVAKKGEIAGIITAEDLL